MSLVPATAVLLHVVKVYVVSRGCSVLKVGVITSCLFCMSYSAGLPTIGDLTRWENVGKPTMVADLLKQRRDSDAAGGTQMESVVLPGATIDGDVLQVGNRVEWK